MTDKSDTPRETRSFEDVYVIQTARIEKLERELTETRRQLEEARKDAERLDWLERNATINFGFLHTEINFPLENDDRGGYDSVREVIDAAIKEQSNGN